MTRKQIEQGIINAFADVVSAENVLLIAKKFSGGDHFGEFEFYKNGVRYVLCIIFIKPNFLKVVCYLRVYHPEITALYNIVEKDDTDDFPIIWININSFMLTENRSGIYNSSDKVEFYIDNVPSALLEKDLVHFATNILYNTVYRFVNQHIMPLTDSLEKIDYLFNDLPYLNNQSFKPNWTVYSTFLPEQVLTGTLLALHQNRADKKVLLDKYLKYNSKFEEGSKHSVDIMRKIIDFYK